MGNSMANRLDIGPLRNAKAELKRGETAVQKLNPVAGEVLDRARFLSGIEPKAMAAETKLSHSLVLRAFKGDGDIGFARLWSLSDEFWCELACQILETRGGKVRRLFEVERERKAG